MTSTDYVDITPNKDGGVLKRIITPGHAGQSPSDGVTVDVHYVGTLKETGEKFDSSRDRGKFFKFNLGQGQVIKGWDVGVATMNKGEKSEFIIRSDYGYGDAGSPPKIPAKATLVFEVELFGWAGEDISPERDGTITRQLIVKGEHLNNPNETSTVQLHAVGKHAGRVFYDKDISYVLGEGSEVGLPDGVDKALRRFCKGEKSVINIRGTKYTYGAAAPAEYGLEDYAELEFTIFLKDFEKVPATWEMSPADKIKHSTQAKDRGTKFLGEGKLKLALNKYKRVEEILEYEKSGDPEEKKQRDALLLAALLNISLVHAKMNEQVKSIEYCDKALELSPNNVKALYRKGCAKLAMAEPEEAEKVFEDILQLEPDNKAAQQQIAVCKAKVKEFERLEKKRFKGMFDRISKDTASA